MKKPLPEAHLPAPAAINQDQLEEKSAAAFEALLQLAACHLNARNQDPKVEKIDLSRGFEITVTITVPVPTTDLKMKVNFTEL